MFPKTASLREVAAAYRNGELTDHQRTEMKRLSSGLNLHYLLHGEIELDYLTVAQNRMNFLISKDFIFMQANTGRRSSQCFCQPK